MSNIEELQRTLAVHIKNMKENTEQDSIDYSKLGRIEKHIFKVASENQLDYYDLVHATKTIEAKHKGDYEEEVKESKKVINHSEKLWDISYHTALFAKAAKHEFWKFY